jgi:hypothetical protein
VELQYWSWVGITVQVVDAMLNTGWLLLALAAFGAAWRHGQMRDRWSAFLALLCAAVLLFPVISITDDLAEQIQIYDTSSAPLSVKTGKELKQIAMAPGAPTILHNAGIPHSELPFLTYVPFVARTLPISSAGATAGIHSPPAVL